MSDADWARCGDAGYGAYGDEYGRGAHRTKGGRHPANGPREILGQIQEPFAAPGQTKDTNDRPGRHRAD